MPRKGQHHTDEQRAKIKRAWETRLPPSEETKRKMSESQSKRPSPSEETRKKISNALKGRVFTEEWGRKISVAKKGKPVNEEARRKLTELSRRKPRSKEWVEKTRQCHIGHTRSEEAKSNMRTAMAKRIETRGWPYPKTSLEKTFATLLDTLEKEYTEQYSIKGRWYDFYLPKHNLIIETHGTFWHADPRFYQPPLYSVQEKIIKKDNIKKEIALSKDYKYAVFWEYDVNNTPDAVLQQLKELLV